MITLTPSNNITNIKKIREKKYLQNESADHTAIETLSIVEKAIHDSDTLEDAIIVVLPPRVYSEKLRVSGYLWRMFENFQIGKHFWSVSGNF